MLLSYECDENNEKVSDLSKNLCMQIAATTLNQLTEKAWIQN